MCNLSAGIREEAEIRGEARGEAKKEKAILDILTHNFQVENPELSAEAALEKAKRYISMLL